jgi:hypothetical protein
MGWGSARDIFDPVAQVLIDLKATPDKMREVLTPLIRQLVENDWDTTDESLEKFQDHPAIVECFRANEVFFPEERVITELVVREFRVSYPQATALAPQIREDIRRRVGELDPDVV